jgi:putative spermidine/putrescine transport system ATP-binding protein
MSDRIAVFNDGIIQQLSAPAELYEAPQSSFVAQFIGENNKLNGTVRSVSDTSCEVEIDGGTIVQALPINISGANSKTMLSLRPERVEIAPAEGSVPNVLEGQIKELIYLGDHIRTRMNVAGHDDFIVKLPNTSNYKGLKEGDITKIGWQTSDCRALDAVSD